MMLHVPDANDDLVHQFFYNDLHDLYCPTSTNSKDVLWIQTVVLAKFLINLYLHKSAINKYRSLFFEKALLYFHIFPAWQ